MPSEIKSEGEIEAVFSFDKVRINTRLFMSQLRKLFPPSELETLCKTHRINKATSQASKGGFRSKIEVEAPQGKFLEIVGERLDGEYYRISNVEIAMDIPCRHEFESMKQTDALIEIMTKRYTHAHFVYDAEEHPQQSTDRKAAYKEGKYGEKTGYWGGKGFRFKIYPRISKITGLPCSHLEWTIQGASNIKAITGIYTIKDMLKFDMEKWFQGKFDKFIEFKEIDHLIHGRFVQNMKRGMKEACGLLDGIKGKLENPELASRLFCMIERIYSAAGLKQFYKKEQKRIKRKKGNRTSWEERVSKLPDHKIQSFTRPIK